MMGCQVALYTDFNLCIQKSALYLSYSHAAYSGKMSMKVQCVIFVLIYNFILLNAINIYFSFTAMNRKKVDEGGRVRATAI